MLLPRDSALRFIEGYKAILLRVLDEAGLARSDSITGDLAAARTHAKDKRDLVEQAIADLEVQGRPVEASVVSAVRTMKVDNWVYLRHTRTFAVFLDKEIQNAYEVKALTTPLNQLVDEPPFVFEAGLFEYEGAFVCDGLALNPVALGPGYRAQFKAAYSAIRKAGRLHVRAAQLR